MARRDSLAEYNAKRDFARTGEPQGSVPDKRKSGARGGGMFVVQKHAASRLHWDLRLEMDGVLKSWAVTKGPSADPADKRLAVRTEDHPINYAEFEGTIPQQLYGGGTVMIWDRGTWHESEAGGKPGLDSGRLRFTLRGERMKGEWLLVRLKPRNGEKRENWLLRKLDDDHATEGDILVERGLTSVTSGRSMSEIARGETPAKCAGRRKPQRKARLPSFRPPQLATLVDRVPTGDAWMHEIKFDGYRAIVAAFGNEVRIYTRTGRDWTDRFASVVKAIARLDLPSCLVDGEIIVLDEAGNPDFGLLQQALQERGARPARAAPMHFHAFDLIALGDADLTALPNLARKERLADLLSRAESPVHVATHVVGAGEELFRAMCEAGQEGIISKQVDGRYASGRTTNWLKVKCIRRQEFVVVGWKASSSAGRRFASLLLAQYEEGDLVYKGNVGTGFTTGEMDDLARRMARLTRKTAAVEIDRADSRGVTWVRPELVVEIGFAEFTREGKVRHASFVGLREDKPASKVETERSVPVPSGSGPVAITNRDRVIFPESGHTKGELADYYAAMAPAILPFLADRPTSLVRCPQGRAKKCFFQKHSGGSLGDGVLQVPIREKGGNTEDYLAVADARGLVQCVQMGTIEFHIWCARSEAVEQPDRMVFDLDPDEGLAFDEVKNAAADIRKQLAGLGLASFAMLTGGKGLHVVVPLTPGASWEAHADFARHFAEALALAEPDRFTASLSKAKRKGRIFIDWLRNQRGSTAIAPYSARARAGAPVAVPVAWNELREITSASRWTIADREELLRRSRSRRLDGWGVAEQALPAY